ncbi:MAG: hypothetical protein PHN49_12695 [Candidatus Omnitrophica bacterium]|nr:hypothetical protein [Candidatus Omnitrophota bacterium]MDD5672484.1 hypothetical protein [Candidatus Omnitrophota bacterium]
MIEHSGIAANILRQLDRGHSNGFSPEEGHSVKQPAGGFSLENVAGLSSNLAWTAWLIRSGLAPDAHCGVSRIGIYTDFT